MGIFSPRDPDQLSEFVRQHPLAWIIVAQKNGFVTSIMPLLREISEDGHISALFGHLPRHHPQVAALRTDPRALILFQGPNAYISPGTVAKPGWAPTWNFTVAAFTVDIDFVPDETDRALRDLVTVMEETRSEPWTVEQMGPRYAELAAKVIAFRATVRSVDARFKHGQDEDPDVFADIVHVLDTNPLAAWMTETRSSIIDKSTADRPDRA